MPEKLTVKVGNSSLKSPMTFKQALRYGQTVMPEKLRVAGFICKIRRSVPEFHGSDYFRVSYLKPDLN